ncbi:integrase-like protein, partial [Murinocardiopsis flavida]
RPRSSRPITTSGSSGQQRIERWFRASKEPGTEQFQYQHVSWQRLLAGAECVQSMSRKGNCLDNAVIESFFGHVKEEFFTHDEFESVEAFITGLDEYIAWFNNERVHTYLEGLSPVQYRAQALAA